MSSIESQVDEIYKRIENNLSTLVSATSPAVIGGGQDIREIVAAVANHANATSLDLLSLAGIVKKLVAEKDEQ